MKPQKPKKPSKNGPEPSRQKRTYYQIYQKYDDEEYFFVSDFSEEKLEELVEKCNCAQVYARIDKAMIKKIESSFSKAVDYWIEIDSGYDCLMQLVVIEDIPENEYADLYKKWQKRFDIYERDLKVYEKKLKEWEEGQKEKRLNKLKEQVAKLESRN
jgi:hypothetical protein